MRPSHRTIAVLAILAALDLGPDAHGQAEPRMDRHGDPLPAGAVGRLGSARRRHGERVADLWLLPDGKTVVSANGQGCGGIVLSDLETGREHRHLPLDMTQHFGVMLAPDGQHAAATDGRRVRLIDLATGRLQWQQTEPSHGGGVVQLPLPVCFSGDGRVLATASANCRFVHLWCTATGKKLHSLDLGLEPGPGGVWGLVASPDGRFLAALGRVADAGVTVVVYELPSGKRLHGFFASGQELRFTPDSKQLVCARSEAPGLLLRDAATGQVLETLPCQGPATCLAFGPDGHTMVVGEPGHVRLWDRRDLRAAGKLSTDGAAVKRLGFSADGRRLLAAVRTLRDTDAVMVWDLKDGSRCAPFSPPGWNAACPCCLSADGRILAVGGANTVRFWDVATGKEHAASPDLGTEVLALAVAPDDAHVATTEMDGTVRLWETRTCAEQARWQRPSAGYPFLAFTAGGKLLADVEVGNGKTMLRDPAKTDQVHVIPPPPMSHCYGVAPDGTVAWRDRDGVRLIHPVTRRETRLTMRSEPPPFLWSAHAVVFAPNSRRLALIDRGAEEGVRNFLGAHGRWESTPVEAALRDAPVVQWDAVTGKELPRLERATDHLVAIAYAPDGRTVAGIARGTDEAAGLWFTWLQLWEAATGKGCLRIDPGTAFLTCLAFAPDGRSFATGAVDGRVNVWDSGGKALACLEGHRGDIRALQFTGDGRRLLSASGDGTVLIWEAPQPESRDPPAPSAAALARCWDALSGNDAAAAYRAAWSLVQAPTPAVALLRNRLAVTPLPDAPQVQRWIAELDDDDFAIRRSAQERLAWYSPLVEPAVREALAAPVSLETRRRLQQLLALRPAPASVPTVRAIQVLEWIASPESQALLQAMAQGAAGSSPVQEAAESLERLAARERARSR